MSLKLMNDEERDGAQLLVCTDCAGELEHSFEIFKNDEGMQMIQCGGCGEEFQLDYALEILKEVE